MFGKIQAKILSRCYDQTLSNFSITLHPSRASNMLHQTNPPSSKWHLQYEIPQNQKLDVKNHTPKISEEFTIIINLTPSNA